LQQENPIKLGVYKRVFLVHAHTPGKKELGFSKMTLNSLYTSEPKPTLQILRVDSISNSVFFEGVVQIVNRA
jgi:hypothetical protein